MIERVWLFSELLKADSVPLLDDFAIYFQGRALTTTVMLGNHLMEESIDEKLECYSLDDVAKEN